jgi:light-regulated signal transduction histidine kinase (bacteriophytochrome)
MLDDEGRRYMTTISEAALRMSRLIDDLLSFSRSGRFEMNWEPVDLGTLAQEVARELDPAAEGRVVEWRIGQLPVVSADHAMLRVVFGNLLSNALKFTQPRERAEIEVGCLPDQGDEIVIFVRDNGVGFDMQYAHKLFRVFERLHGMEEFEGTGIGLANVRRIINRHGGRTWAESKVDDGATFYFSLPQAAVSGGSSIS